MGPPPIIATKLFVPSRRPRLVARPGVTARLDATLDPGHRLTLVSAPPGFGKSTLVGAWLADRPHAGWLSLDDADDDPARFLVYLAAALERAGLPAEPADGPVPFVNDLARAAADEPEARWVLVLDDYHVIAAPEIHETVAFLLDHGPDRLHLVLTTRSDPPLPLARLRGRGQLVELRAADLRFTADEARRFLAGTMGLDLTTLDVEALENRTEGWVAGLQLAALSLRGVGNPDEAAAFVRAFTGSHRFVIDYLADEVLARQPAPVREFLLRTAVLDRLHGPLCDAVTGRAGGSATLDTLDRANVFVVPLDAERSWYRYHHLFADVLRARLLAEHPDAVPGLHERASAWYAAHGLAVDAVRHALAAGDDDRAAFLMEEAVPDLRRGRQDSLLISWIRSLPDAVVRSRPVLGLVAGWSALMTGDLDAAEARFDAADAALAAGERDPGRRASWADTDDLRTARPTLSVYRASVAQGRGDVAGTVHHARHALDHAGAEDHFVRGAAGGFLGLAAWAAGDVDEALATFSDAVGQLHAAGNLVDELDATVVLADLWIAAGRPGRARRLYEEGLRRAVAGTRAAADFHVGLAALDREQDDLAGADAHLESARVLAERASITENRHRWYVVAASVRAARGEADAALEHLEQGAALYRPGFYPDVRPIPAIVARVRIAAGDLAAAADWAARRGLDLTDEPAYLHEYEHLTLVRLRLAQHRADPPLLGLLDRLHAAAAAVGRAGSVQEIRMLQALAHDARGDGPRALAALERSVGDTPEPDAAVRLYRDEGAPMRALLRRAADTHAWARRLLGAAPAGPDPLSARELEVLRLLDTDLTGPEIARRLYVTVNTLRTHTKRIFTKLDVTTRAAAVRRARGRGLL